jgi:hypothetical protein
MLGGAISAFAALDHNKAGLVDADEDVTVDCDNDGVMARRGVIQPV